MPKRLLAKAAQGAALNAFIHHDPAQVRADARAADAARAPLGARSARCTAFRWP